MQVRVRAFRGAEKYVIVGENAESYSLTTDSLLRSRAASKCSEALDNGSGMFEC